MSFLYTNYLALRLTYKIYILQYLLVAKPLRYAIKFSIQFIHENHEMVHEVKTVYTDVYTEVHFINE